MRYKLLIPACAGIFVTAAIAGFMFANDAKPIDLAKNGDIDGTIAIARSYLSALRENDWNSFKTWKLHPEFLRVPDQDYAKDPGLRAAANTFTAGPLPGVYKDEVAFYTTIYLNTTFHVVPGQEGYPTFEGCVIVGWKDGRVTRVPWQEIRLNPFEDGWVYVFPGMKVYNDSLPRLGEPLQSLQTGWWTRVLSAWQAQQPSSSRTSRH